MLRPPVKPKLIRWAHVRSGRSDDALGRRFPRLRAWEEGTITPTWRQLQDFAAYTHTPVGYFFLDEPPEEQVPIPDLRTIGDRGVDTPSPDLLDVIYLCQQRQAWYIEYSASQGLPPSELNRNHELLDLPDPEIIAREIAGIIGLGAELRRKATSWEDALRQLRIAVEDVGVLVMISGIVGSNTHRALDPEEFRGFALVHPQAPLIFINGQSSKSAQMFTLAHELGHVWLGQSALSDADTKSFPGHEVERWCNKLAAELLVPMEEFTPLVNPAEPTPHAMQRLAREFKVSTLVILRRMHEAGLLSREVFWKEHALEVARLQALHQDTTGGDYYRTQPSRVGHLFAKAIVTDTLEGHTMYRDAFRLLGVSTTATFNELARRLGVEG